MRARVGWLAFALVLAGAPAWAQEPPPGGEPTPADGPMGPPAAPAEDPEPPLPPLDELIKKLPFDRRDEAEITIWQLTQHGAAAVEPLAALLDQGSVAARKRAAEALLGLRALSAPAAPALLKSLKWDPPAGQEGGPGDLTELRANCWRGLAIFGGSPAVALAKTELTKALRAAAMTDAAEVPGWTGAAIGCWLRQGGKGADVAITKLAIGALAWKGGAVELLRAIGEARDPGGVAALIAVVDYEERDAAALKQRNDDARAKAERAKRDPPTPEVPGPERMICHEALRRVTGQANPTAGAWLVWWKANRDWLFWSAKDSRLAIDEAAKKAGVPSAEYRATHPWADGEGPDLPPWKPMFHGPLARRRPVEDEGDGDSGGGDLPGGG